MSLVAHYQDGAVGVANHRVRDAAHKSTSYSAQTPTAHDDQASSHLFTQMDDLPVRASPDQVGVRHGYPLALNLLHLPIEERLGLVHGILELVLHFIGRPRQYGVRKGPLYSSWEHVGYVQL